MSDSIIIAAERSLNQQKALSATEALISKALDDGKRCITLTIDDLNTPWQSPVKPYHFRSGCGPVEALSVANRIIQQAEADLVVIRGRDFLRSEHSQEDRHQKMDIYDEMSIPEAYTQLARHFCDHQGIDGEAFVELRNAIFDNLKATASQLDLKLPADSWYEPLTELFRGVDCANPVVDFEGIVVVAHKDTDLQPLTQPVSILGVGVGISDADGPSHARELARYHALEKAVHYAEVQSGLDVASVIKEPSMPMEAYTCYPVVPLALMIKAASLQNAEQILSFLKTKPLTCTGGMNLGRAPWNNPALNGLIAVCESLQDNNTIGLVHGNGGLGYRQGIALLSSQ